MQYGVYDAVPQNRALRITFGYSALLPEFFFNEDLVKRIVEQQGFNVISVNIDAVVPGFRKLVVILKTDKPNLVFGEVGRMLSHSIDENFYLVFDVQAERFEDEQTAPAIQVPLTTTISLASVAILALVGFLLIRKFS